MYVYPNITRYFVLLCCVVNYYYYYYGSGFSLGSGSFNTDRSVRAEWLQQSCTRRVLLNVSTSHGELLPIDSFDSFIRVFHKNILVLPLWKQDQRFDGQRTNEERQKNLRNSGYVVKVRGQLWPWNEFKMPLRMANLVTPSLTLDPQPLQKYAATKPVTTCVVPTPHHPTRLKNPKNGGPARKRAKLITPDKIIVETEPPP